ncbi:transformer-2 protein homolog alpha isoform X2 [Nematostella vectensis]|uniref:transformer-2 protein homolog alpha isoform X2 n=1 Tax=Nematostella vectensis TaxID=45351 RepID=UPI0020778A95|nr:transformer-2 protein homolog alpha isoform X2 [Nematostella vectensis]
MSENNYRGSSEEKEESPRQSASRSRSKSPSHSRSSAHSSKSKSRSRSHSYSRSRSHSPVRRPRSSSRRNKSHSRSRSPNPYYKGRRSRSPSPYNRGRRGRDSSHSPLSNRKRHQGNRDNPSPSRCLGVFGLSLYTTERDLRPVFEKYGPVEAIQIVYDHQTGRSRGFGFVYYEDTKDAEVAKERTTGIELDGRRIRVDYSVTKRAHTPTPGVYMGKASQHRDSGRRGGGRRYDDYDDRRDYDYRGGRDRDYYRDDYYRGSSSYYRSRSRSYSPRRY